jgi:tetratricopeptide (TPR) repeat protein
MPTIYRAMRRAGDGLPVVGFNSKELGVRIPPNPNSDIDLDENGNVVLNGKGMSVAENWRALLPHLVPKRLKAIFPGASGSNGIACFRLGLGPFLPGLLNARLALVLKAHEGQAGNVVPASASGENEFQSDLAATRGDWAIDETWFMLEDRLFHNSDYFDYIRLLFDLHRAIAEGWDETEKGEALRDRMDVPGSRLTSDERASLSGISADFYSLTDTVFSDLSPMTPDALSDLQLIFEPQQSREFHRALEVLRKHARSVPPASLAYLRGKIWMEAGEHQIAAAFLERASELDPHNANFRYMALHEMSKANPASAERMAHAILADWEQQSPRLVLKSLDLLLNSIRAHSTDRSQSELKSFIPIFQNSILQFETTGEAENDPSLLVSSINNLDYCQHQMSLNAT